MSSASAYTAFALNSSGVCKQTNIKQSMACEAVPTINEGGCSVKYKREPGASLVAGVTLRRETSVKSIFALLLRMI
jgi:hypothetical protein